MTFESHVIKYFIRLSGVSKEIFFVHLWCAFQIKPREHSAQILYIDIGELRVGSLQ